MSLSEYLKSKNFPEFFLRLIFVQHLKEKVKILKGSQKKKEEKKGKGKKD